MPRPRQVLEHRHAPDVPVGQQAPGAYRQKNLRKATAWRNIHPARRARSRAARPALRTNTAKRIGDACARAFFPGHELDEQLSHRGEKYNRRMKSLWNDADAAQFEGAARAARVHLAPAGPGPVARPARRRQHLGQDRASRTSSARRKTSSTSKAAAGTWRRSSRPASRRCRLQHVLRSPRSKRCPDPQMVERAAHAHAARRRRRRRRSRPSCTPSCRTSSSTTRTPTRCWRSPTRRTASSACARSMATRPW